MKIGFLTTALTRVLDLAGYVLIVARGDGKVLVLGTDNAPNRLISINSASPLEHEVLAYRTDHFQKIVDALRRRFGALSVDGLGVWFEADLNAIRCTIAEYDLASGMRVRDGPFELYGPVWVKGAGAGTISALTERGAVVKLRDPKGELREVIAPRSLMKPHLRSIPATC